MKRYTEVRDGLTCHITEYKLVSKERRGNGWWCTYEGGPPGLVPFTEAEEVGNALCRTAADLIWEGKL